MSRISFDPNLKEWPLRCFDRSCARICVMGDIGVGKTSLILRWLRGVFEHFEQGAYSEDLYHRSLLMHELHKKNGMEEDDFIDEGDDDLKKYSALDVQILDCDYVDMTYDSVELVTAQIKQCDAFVLCFEPTSRESFENLNGLFHKIVENAENPSITICLTKSDLYLDSEIKIDEVAERLGALGYSMDDDYEEVSAKTGENVDQLFYSVLRKISRYKKQARMAYRKQAVETGEVQDATPSLLQSTPSPSPSLQSAKLTAPARVAAPRSVAARPDEEEKHKQKNACCVIC